MSSNGLTKVKMTFNGNEMIVKMNDNGTSKDFVSMLPLTLTFDDYVGTEKVSDLPRRLSKKDTPDGAKPVIGDVTYFSPWGNLAIFYKNFRYADGLLPLGKIESGLEYLDDIEGHEVLLEVLN